MNWRLHRAAAILGFLPAIAAANTGIIQVTGVRSWSHADSTRVIVETTGSFEYKTDRAHTTDRFYIDILNARPSIGQKRLGVHEIGDHLARRVRLAETSPNVTRIVFDLAAPVNFTVTTLDAPNRMVIELRPLLKSGSPSVGGSGPVTSNKSASRRPPFVYPAPVYTPAAARPRINIPPAPSLTASAAENPLPFFLSLPSPMLTFATNAIKPAVRVVAPNPAASIAASTRVIAPSKPLLADASPRASENATRSLTRALGLKVNRVIIDAGHGGHDEGTLGPHGVKEKDVVLDTALRLAKLVQEGMGAEVILTRSDDTFIPLHTRTAIANDHRADLFISIHANSSPSPDVAGTETFFLNFSNSPEATAIAARENAGADKSVGELKDLIQSITLNDKIEESRTLATTVQTALHAQVVRTNPLAHNRGVKRAPFVVLIGASMPSILAEIGFLSNSRDESNLAKPDYRQKIAEAFVPGSRPVFAVVEPFRFAPSGCVGNREPVAIGPGLRIDPDLDHSSRSHFKGQVVLHYDPQGCLPLARRQSRVRDLLLCVRPFVKQKPDSGFQGRAEEFERFGQWRHGSRRDDVDAPEQLLGTLPRRL